jgi:hypothetical protein
MFMHFVEFVELFDLQFRYERRLIQPKVNENANIY